MKKIFLLSFILLFFLSVTITVEARSGCCSHHGGVCGCECCDGTPLSATCAPYYPSCNNNPPQPSPPPLPINTNKNTNTNVYEDISGKDNLLVLVQEVIDGDTIRIFYNKDTIEKVRIIGIDTPETVDPRKPVECFGKEASQKMKELVDGKTVKLVLDSISSKRDKYDRLLRYVYLDDKDIGAEMIKQGYAYAYITYPFEKMEEYKGYERQTRENKIGLWAPGVCDNSVEESNQTVLGEITENQKVMEETKLTNTIPAAEEKTIETIPSQNQTSKEDNFIGGFFTGIVLTLLILWGYKKFKPGKIKPSKE